MKKIYYAFALLVLLMSACKKESNTLKEPEEKVALGKVVVYHLKNGGQVTVVINNAGEYVVGGDVILSKDQIAYLEYNKIGSDKTATTESTFTNEFQKLWPGGIVYYTINDATNNSSIAYAIAHWEANTPIRFIQRTNQANYVDFNGIPAQGGGSSKLGMIGGRQTIELQPYSGYGTVIHEIGHAVGLMHEQSRADRDQYININYSNIQPNWTSQYNIYNPGTGYQIGAFDYESVMMYPSYAGGPNNPAYPGNTTPQMTRKDGTTWNATDVLSQGDIDGINYLYRPIYIKVISIFNESESYYNVSATNEDVRQVYDVYIEFYTNEALTIPLTLISPIGIKINNTGLISMATIPSGSHSVYLGQSVDEYSTEYGVYRYHNTTSLGVVKGVGYILPNVN